MKKIPKPLIPRNKWEENKSIKDDNNVLHQKEQKNSLLSDALKKIKKDIGHSPDIIIREAKIGTVDIVNIAVIYVDGLADKDLIHHTILQNLMVDLRETRLQEEISTEKVAQFIKEFSLSAGELEIIINYPTNYEKMYETILSGDSILLVDGSTEAFKIGTKGWEGRGVEEPSSEQLVRGPKDGFTENIRTNTSLIRRRINDINLVFEPIKVGKRSKTEVAITYINEVANDKIVEEVRERLAKIDIDAILESGYVEALIQDETYTPFPTVYNTERPDAVVGGLLEGRVAILVDGTPFVLVVPALFIHFMQSSEDYYQRADISTLIRLLRVGTFLLSLLTPAAFIAVTTYHQEMLPTTLLISLTAQREGVPFPAFIEAVFMELTFEILREAGVRMPRAVGAAISIVGALVLGQAAVEAGLVSATMVIVVSLTAIASFVTPKFNMAISVRMLRFVFMVLAATFGLFGIIIGLIILIAHLCSLRSFGVPYLLPFAPFVLKDQKDAIIRLSIWSMNTRPKLVSGKDKVKERTSKPSP
ncbi:spore germination protein [Metabacillus litoralis]|uniref:spore germination protein n=1 Tax=Metabacillus litoralis TaxID=152268 RepID=UPI001CFCE716|nr:spore germination protein [Metabacillus litoralis]